MDKFRRSFDSPDAFNGDDAVMVAESMLADFADLVAMLDRQLTDLPSMDERARAHILDAKAGAERGVLLSTQLVRLLRPAN